MNPFVIAAVAVVGVIVGGWLVATVRVSWGAKPDWSTPARETAPARRSRPEQPVSTSTVHVHDGGTYVNGQVNTHGGQGVYAGPDFVREQEQQVVQDLRRRTAVSQASPTPELEAPR